MEMGAKHSRMAAIHAAAPVATERSQRKRATTSATPATTAGILPTTRLSPKNRNRPATT
jgi:hypothetical protein